jgi:very-short-patch-repair endonuclease
MNKHNQSGTTPTKKLIRERSKRLRRGATKAEKMLWFHLRCEQLGYRFRRQQPIGRYIADFACLERRLLIELDGGHHGNPRQLAYDEERTQWLESQGFRIVRFWNTTVFQELEGVVEAIAEELEKPSGSGSPPRR